MISWKKPNRYYVDSECGQYRVSKIVSMGSPSYTCWRKVYVGGRPHWDVQRGAAGQILVFETPVAAKEHFAGEEPF